MQPVGKNENGGPIDAFTVDLPQLVVVQKKTVKRGNKGMGGPIPAMRQKETPKR